MDQNTSATVTDIVKILSELKSEMIKFIPDLVSALVVLVIGIVLAYSLKWFTAIVVRWSLKVLPERISNRPGFIETVQSCSIGGGKIVFFVVVFLTFTTILKKMGLEVMSSWFQGLAKNLPSIVVALVILFLGWKLKDFLIVFVNRTLSRTDFSHSRIASNSLAWAAFTISALVALEQAGIDMGLVVTLLTVVAGVTSGGVALMLALGAKSSISDILSCYQIGRLLKVGQKVEVLGVSGVVEAIGPTYVSLSNEKGRINVPGNRFRQEVTIVLN